jgi:hypothetical protein
LKRHRDGGAAGACAYAVHGTGAGIHDRYVEGGEISIAFVSGWNGRGERFSPSQSEPLPTCKPECPIATAAVERHRTTRFRAKLVLLPRGARFPNRIQEIVIGVENAIPQVLVYLAVKIIRTTLCCEIHYSTREAPPLRAEIAGLHLEFLDRILRRNQHGQVDVADVQGLAVEILGTLISKGAIDLVVSPAKWIHSHWRTRRTALWNYRWSQTDQVKDIASVERKFVRFTLFDNRAYGGRFGIDQGRLAFHGDAFGSGANRHFEVHFQRILYVQDDAGLDYRLESHFLDLDAIPGRWKIRNVVGSRLIREAPVAHSGADIDDGDCSAGDYCLIGIGDASGERGVGGLCSEHAAMQRTQEQC